MHKPSTHLNSKSGHGDECEVAALTVSSFFFVVVLSAGGFCVVAAFRIVLRNRLLVLAVVVGFDETVVVFGLMNIGTTPSPVETILSPSESLWSSSELTGPKSLVSK